MRRLIGGIILGGIHSLEVVEGVDGLPPVADFKMEMGAGRISRVATIGDQRAAVDVLSYLDGDS